MEDSKIEWTDNTFNPWWGCQRVSPGCEHCYAETFSKRVGRDLWGPEAVRRIASEAYWRKPLAWDEEARKAGKPTRVFCASMCDVFEDRPDLVAPRQRLWDLIDRTPNLTWQLLTKRPENIDHLYPLRWDTDARDAFYLDSVVPPNVWLMTTAEDQERFDKRVPVLTRIPATVRGLSIEPMIGPVDLSSGHYEGGIDWVIVGGESGPGARLFDMDWARRIRDRCASHGVAFFMKQTGSVYAKAHGIPGKGDRLEDLPADLRIREFPESSIP